MTMDRNDPAYRGQADYRRPLLTVYDAWVLGFTTRWVWHAPTARMVEDYRRHIRSPHLDVGPGTGYFIERSGLAPGSPVTLLDPNRAVLDYASRRLRQFEVTTVQADVLKPLPVSGPFASAALNAVIHCLPGPGTRKALAIEHVASVLEPDGVLFGATVLGRTGQHSRLGRAFLAAFNRRGAFDNLDDTAEWLHDSLAASFESVELETLGSLAVFAATRPRRAAGD